MIPLNYRLIKFKYRLLIFGLYTGRYSIHLNIIFFNRLTIHTMKKPNDNQSEDKAARRLQQFREARESVDDECDKTEEGLENTINEESENKVRPPKPLKSDENPRTTEHGSG